MTVSIFLALLGVPLIEIAVFIEVGQHIGLGATLALIVATAMAGTALLRYQGLATLARARETVARGDVPLQEVLDGVCLLVAGALLLTPGFFTDAAGALLLVPIVRRLIQRWALDRFALGAKAAMARRRTEDGVIEIDYTVVRDDDRPASGADDTRSGR